MPALRNPTIEAFAQGVACGKPQQRAFREAGFDVRNHEFAVVAKRPEVAARIRELIAERLAAAGVTAERTKAEIARIAYHDVRKIFDEEGNLLPVHKLDDDTAAGITSIKVETVYRGRGENAIPVTVMQYKFAPKMEALGLLAKHFKIVGDVDEATNNLADALAARLNAAKRRTGAPPAEEVEDAKIIERRAIVYDPAEEGDPADEFVDGDPIGDDDLAGVAPPAPPAPPAPRGMTPEKVQRYIDAGLLAPDSALPTPAPAPDEEELW